MMMASRLGLLGEVVGLSIDTLRASKMRSALTVLGVVIGITSIVGMTSLIRGFDQSLRNVIGQLGPDTIYVQKFGALSFSSGKTFLELMKRPNITPADGRAIAELCPSVGIVDIWVGMGGPGSSRSRVSYGNLKTKQLSVMGATEAFAQVSFIKMELGRFFMATEVQHRRQVIVLGQTAYLSLFPSVDPIGKKVRVGDREFTVVGIAGTRPSVGGLGSGADDFVVIPYSTHEKFYGKTGVLDRSAMVAVIPRDGATRDQAMAEIEQVMRIRHSIRLDKPNDFDMLTQDAAVKVWEQISRATFLGLVVISSIALMVGGIGVMAIMMISVTERTKEIGVRKALGARRREILWQFLIEAGILTSAGGLLGIVCGSSIGLLVHWLSGFPVSLPWWSFALGIGFSASIGIFFGMVPAIKASRLDPIEALRYE
jgi:putative ABC transport system permease protein